MNDQVKKEIQEVLDEPTELKTPIYTLRDLEVTMLDYPVNPYKTMFLMATQTWGQDPYKWEKVSPETRFEVVKMILQKKALPLAVEHPTFSFQVNNIDRSTFDQLARARVGIVFASRGQKDDNLHQAGVVLPTKVEYSEHKDEIVNHMLKAKELYVKMVEEYKIPNWACRCVLPMYTSHGFIFSANYMSIQGMLSKRLETTEQEGCIAFSILVRERIKEKFPLLAEYLRPSCDFAKRDMNAAYNGFSDAVSVPHSSDDRQPGYDKTKFPPKWDEPCTNIKLVEKEIGVKFPEPTEWLDYSFDNLPDIDKNKFYDKE